MGRQAQHGMGPKRPDTNWHGSTSCRAWHCVPEIPPRHSPMAFRPCRAGMTSTGRPCRPTGLPWLLRRGGAQGGAMLPAGGGGGEEGAAPPAVERRGCTAGHGGGATRRLERRRPGEVSGWGERSGGVGGERVEGVKLGFGRVCGYVGEYWATRPDEPRAGPPCRLGSPFVWPCLGGTPC